MYKPVYLQSLLEGFVSSSSVKNERAKREKHNAVFSSFLHTNNF